MKSWVGIIALCVGVTLVGPSPAQAPPGGLPIPVSADFGDPFDAFGTALAADGSWAVVTGSFGEAFYVYERLPSGNWTRRQRIVPPTLGQTFFRTPHLRGNRLVISRPSDPTQLPESGTIYVYERPDTGSPFELSATLRPDDPQTADRFGYGLAQSGDRIFVGASSRDEGPNVDQGVVYVLRNDGGTWIQEARLTPADAAASDRFGQDLTFDGQDLIVGAQRHLVAGFRGAAYVYRLVEGTWTEVQKLVEPGTPGNTFTRFGYKVSAADGQLLVQGIGWNSEYFFTRDESGVWGSPQRLPDPFLGSGLSFSWAQYGDVVGDRALVKALAQDGSEHLVSFRLESGIWNQVSRVAIPAPLINMNSEAPAVIATGGLLSGQPLFDASPSALDQGAVLTFSFGADAVIGGQTQPIWHGSGNTPDRVGSSVASDGEWLATSAPGADGGGIDRDALYLFRLVGNEWQLSQTVHAANQDESACALAMHGDLLAIGRCYADVGGVQGRGRVEIYKRGIDDVWTSLCDLVPVAAGDPQFATFGNGLAMSEAGIWASIRQTDPSTPTFTFQVESFPLPTTSCAAGQTLAQPPAGLSYRFNAGSLRGSRGALSLDCASFNVPLASCVTQIEVFDGVDGVFSLTQTIPMAAPGPSFWDSPLAPAIDGDRLAVPIFERIGNSIDRTGRVSLYELVAGDFVLARKIDPVGGASEIGIRTALRGSALLLHDQTISANGGVAVYDFSSGSRLQEISIPDLGIEDDELSNLHFGASDRAVIGWPGLNRGGYNNSGGLFTLQLVPNRGTNSWTVAPVEGAPLPERLFQDYFELTP